MTNEGHPDIDEMGLRDSMLAYQSGRADGFELLYASLAPLLRRYLLSLARDGVRAEDLVQETFLQIHRSRRSYSAAHPVLPWVLAIARHVFLMDRRSRERRGRREVSPGRAVGEPAARAETDRVLEREAVAHALAQLPPERRETVVLHHVEGLGFREIAVRLGISEAAAKMRSSRGIAGIRALLTGRRKRGKADGS